MDRAHWPLRPAAQPATGTTLSPRWCLACDAHLPADLCCTMARSTNLSFLSQCSGQTSSEERKRLTPLTRLLLHAGLSSWSGVFNANTTASTIADTAHLPSMEPQLCARGCLQCLEHKSHRRSPRHFHFQFVSYLLKITTVIAFQSVKAFPQLRQSN